MKPLAAALLTLAIVAVGCGDDDSTVGSVSPTTTSQAEQTETTTPKPASTPEQAMVDCLEEVLYTVDQQSKTEFQVRSGGGTILANIDVFKTEAEAKEFADQLTVDYVAGGTRVAVVLAAASAADARVIGDCLNK